MALLNFDHHTIEKTDGGSQVGLILAVLFENMARQGKLMIRLGVQESLKGGLLLLIGKIEEF